MRMQAEERRVLGAAGRRAGLIEPGASVRPAHERFRHYARLVLLRHEGQALVFVGLVLLFLVPLLLVAVEAAARGLHRQQVEDALQQATRSAAQTFSYGEFAQNDLTFRSEAELIAHARQILSINLRDLEGLAEPPDEVAKRVKWEVLPNGGTCILAGYTAALGTPTVCATLEVPMKSIAGLGDWDAHLVAAASLDHIR